MYCVHLGSDTLKSQTRMDTRERIGRMTDLMEADELNHQELQNLARWLTKGMSMAQKELAEELDVSPSTISRAVTTVGPKYQRIQLEIVELITGNTLRRKVTFEVVDRYDPDEDENS